jgi:hypothetical protein
LDYCVKDGRHGDAEEFLARFVGLYLVALNEELVELHSRKPTSAPNVKELEEEAQSAEGQTGVRKRDHTVCPLLFLPLHCAGLDIVESCDAEGEELEETLTLT